MPETLTVELPYPPALRSYYTHTRSGGYFVSAKGASYRQVVKALWYSLGVPVVPGRLAVAVRVYHPDRRTRDLDNLGKALLDALKGCFIRDDGDIDDLRYTRCEVRKGGLVVVTITSLTGS